MGWAIHVVQLLLWAFVAGNAVIVYRKALALFLADDTPTDRWIGLSIGAFFLVIFAVVVYLVGAQGLVHLAALAASAAVAK